jgi:hypothetical protein
MIDLGGLLGGEIVPLELGELCHDRLLFRLLVPQPLHRALALLEGLAEGLGRPVNPGHHELARPQGRLELRAAEVLAEGLEEARIEARGVVLVVAESVGEEDHVGRFRGVDALAEVRQRLRILELPRGVEAQPEEIEPVNGFHASSRLSARRPGAPS